MWSNVKLENKAKIQLATSHTSYDEDAENNSSDGNKTYVNIYVES